MKQLIRERMKKSPSFPEKSRGLFFTIGLVIALGLSYSAFTLKFEKKQYTLKGDSPLQDDIFEIPRTFPKEPEKPKLNEKKIKESKKKVSTLIDQYVTIDNLIDAKKEFNYVDGDDPIDLTNLPSKDDEDPTPIALLDRLPLYEGCDITASHQEKKECLEGQIFSKISRDVKVRISDNPFADTETIWVTFVIGKDGVVSNVDFPRGGDEYYTRQIEESIRSFPKFTPGIVKSKEVACSFSMPIKITYR